MEKKIYVFILFNERDTYYCGYTDDLEKRFQAHVNGRGAKYTKANKPIKIVWQKEFNTKQEAQKAEYRIKRLKRADKEKLILS